MFKKSAYSIGPSPGAPDYLSPHDRTTNRRAIALAVLVLAVLGASVMIPTAVLRAGERGECWCRTVLHVFSYGPATDYHYADGYCYREAPQYCRCDTDVIPVGHAYLDRGPHIIAVERGKGQRLAQAKKAVDRCGGCDNLCSLTHVTWGKGVPSQVKLFV